MIFITVGTHEQSFERLVKKVDELREKKVINEEVFIQTGFTDYEPKNCEWNKLISYKEMNDKINEARIVITHGGPASFLAPLQIGKIPVVVPRRAEYNEHINNHQVDFANRVAEKYNNIIVVNDIDEIENVIINYEKIIKKMNNGNSSNNKKFIEKFEQEINKMFE